MAGSKKKWKHLFYYHPAQKNKIMKGGSIKNNRYYKILDPTNGREYNINTKKAMLIIRKYIKIIFHG